MARVERASTVARWRPKTQGNICIPGPAQGARPLRSACGANACAAKQCSVLPMPLEESQETRRTSPRRQAVAHWPTQIAHLPVASRGSSENVTAPCPLAYLGRVGTVIGSQRIPNCLLRESRASRAFSRSGMQTTVRQAEEPRRGAGPGLPVAPMRTCSGQCRGDPLWATEGRHELNHHRHRWGGAGKKTNRK